MNKLETFEDALFEGSKTSTHKTEKLDADLLPWGKQYADNELNAQNEQMM